MTESNTSTYRTIKLKDAEITEALETGRELPPTVSVDAIFYFSQGCDHQTSSIELNCLLGSNNQAKYAEKKKLLICTGRWESRSNDT